MTETNEKINIELSEQDLSDQTSKLVEEFDDIDKEDAEKIKNGIRKIVREQVEKQGKNWSDEVVEAFTNLAISMFIQGTRHGAYQGNGPWEYLKYYEFNHH